jgi:hypothetical protein
MAIYNKDGNFVPGEADIIKTELIDFLLENNHYDLFINEHQFLRGNRQADLIAISDNMTIGYEIKSEKDSLKRLAQQIKDYSKVFNRVYLVLAEKFIKRIEIKTLSKNIGIIIVKKNREKNESHEIKILRKATTRILLDKSAILSLLWRKDLEKLVPKKKYTEMYDLKNYVFKKCSIKTIQKQIIISLKSRYEEAYKLFLKDRGNYTTVEDMRIITGLKKNLVFSDTSIA